MQLYYHHGKSRIRWEYVNQAGNTEIHLFELWVYKAQCRKRFVLRDYWNRQQSPGL